MMKPLQILMPMGGLGQRFKDVGVETPKPLIPVLGVPMFQRALASYDQYPGPKRHIFVVRKDTDEQYGLAGQIRSILPDAFIAILDHNTGGAVETCLLAEDALNPEWPLVIMDCDIAFEAPDYFRKIEAATQNADYDGLLLSFESTDPRYSYATLSSDGSVARTAEKQPISKNALMGAYFFTSAMTFLQAAHELVTRQLGSELKEYYVSLVYNILLDKGKRIGLAHGAFHCFGTPEELAAYGKRGQR